MGSSQQNFIKTRFPPCLFFLRLIEMVALLLNEFKTGSDAPYSFLKFLSAFSWVFCFKMFVAVT